MALFAFVSSPWLPVSAHARTNIQLRPNTFVQPVLARRTQCPLISCEKLYPDPLPPQYDDDRDDDDDEYSEESLAASSASYLDRLNRATANRFKKQSRFTSQDSEQPSFASYESYEASLASVGVLRTTLAREEQQSSINHQQNQSSSPRMSASTGDSQGSHAYMPASRAFWRIGWLTWWVQLVLTIVSAVIVGFALTFPSADVGTSASAIGFVLIGIAIVVSFVSLFCTFGYTRLSLWLQSASSSEASSKAPSKISYRLRVGISVALLGLSFATLGLQAVVGTLLARLLTTGIGSSNFRSLDKGGSVASPLVQPVDVLVVQASANIILALLSVVLSSLWFRRRSEIWEQNSGTV